ncbi:MAG: hypothetical protein ACREBE_18130, partial [bacterium]
MEPIDRQELATVTGGFAFLAALPTIFSGISSITGLVNAFKGSGSAPQAAPAQPQVAAPTTPHADPHRRSAHRIGAHADGLGHTVARRRRRRPPG